MKSSKGAQKWVGSAKWHYGSFYLWGDVPALMPPVKRVKGNGSWFYANENPDAFCWCNNSRVPEIGTEGVKVAGLNWSGSDKPGYVAKAFNDAAVANLYADRDTESTKQHGSGPEWWRTGNGTMSSKSSARKAASAQIAKIPFPLAQHIAKVFKPY